MSIGTGIAIAGIWIFAGLVALAEWAPSWWFLSAAVLASLLTVMFVALFT